MQNHTEAFWYSYLGCGYIKKTHLFIPRVSFPCNKFQFLLLSSSLLSQQFWKQKLGVEERHGEMATCPGLGVGMPLFPGLRSKIQPNRQPKNKQAQEPGPA